jgi:hypothetical protein
MTLIYDGTWFRPTGFREPLKGECYLNSQGRVVQCTVDGQKMKRTVLRCAVVTTKLDITYVEDMPGQKREHPE